MRQQEVYVNIRFSSSSFLLLWYHIHLHDLIYQFQVITCGILLLVMAVGNFANTVQTLIMKSRVKAKIKRGKSRLDLNQGSDDKSL